MERYDPQAIEVKWQQVWADEQSFHVPNPSAAELAGGDRQEVLRGRDAPVPLRQPAHGAHARLHDRRRRHALPPPQRLPGAAADGLRRVRPAGRERRDQGGRPPAPDHRAQHRQHPRPDAPDRLGDRLAARALDARSRLLPLDAVAVPALPRAGPRLPQGGAGQVVPERPDRARERAGLVDGRCERCGAVVESTSRGRSGSSASPTTRTRCSTTWRPSTGPSRSRLGSATGSAAREGARVVFRIEERDEDVPVFTTRPDTLFGATFFVLAPEHELVRRRLGPRGEVLAYVRRTPPRRRRRSAPGDREGRASSRACTPSTRSTASALPI